MSLIQISNLTFAYEGSCDTIFENATFQIDTDWRLGFTGRNGRGKTTFLNLLRGKYAYQGSISASVVFDYFPYEVTDKHQNTIEIADCLCSNYELWQLQKELSLLDVSADVLYRPFSTLSNGEQTKVLLAVLFLNQNHFLLIDEPTNHLDEKARGLVSNYLSSKKGFILVSHDRQFLDNCVDHILSINKTNIEIQRGNFSSWWENKKMQDEFEFSENDKLQKEIKKLSSAAKRTETWSKQAEKAKNHARNSGINPDRGYVGHKAAKVMKRSKSIEARQENAMNQKAKLLKNLETAENLSIKPLPYHTDQFVEASDLSIFYGNRKVCGPLRFTVNEGDRIVLRGRNGSGKSSLLKCLMGESLSYTGSLHIGTNLTISYISQDTSYLSGNLKSFAGRFHLEESMFKAILRKLDFSREQFEKDMKDFSEGQKKKVLLAKSLCEHAHLYIWDEPLNFIDALSRMQIEKLILKDCPTMIFVEHDRTFSDGVATKVVEL
jgi:lincosamide and streptogramin A transport system ATP-binding/permease protein